jgi:hypothetical protein
MVMPADNLWRWMNLAAAKHQHNESQETGTKKNQDKTSTNVISILRLKMLFVAAKI